jgi:hypothetical protein
MTRRIRVVLVLVAMAALVPAASSEAQLASSAVKLVNLDLAVPDSPAFAILGLSPETVVRPSTPRDLATTLLNGVDRRGNLQSGLAVDFAPLFLFGGNGLTYNDYKTRKSTQIWGRTQLSFATAKGVGEGDKSLRASAGIRSTLWDKGDPRLDAGLVRCLDAIPPPPAPVIALITQAARDQWEAEQTAQIQPKVQECQAASKKRRWNASSFAIGVAPSFQSQTGESGDLDYAGSALWGSLALGLSTSATNFGQFIVQGRYRNKELVPNKNVKGTFFEQDSTGLGLRLMLGEADRAVVVESEFVRLSPKGGDNSTSFTLSGGGQMKLATGVWLSVAVGGSLKGSTDEEKGAFVLSSFKWAMSREPAIKAP